MALIVALLPGGLVADQHDNTGWIDHGGDRGGSRYSSLGLINRDNVEALRPAWTYRTGDGAGVLDEAGHAGLQATPILVPEEGGGALVFCTPFNEVIALDPATGQERWRFDPKVKRDQNAAQYRCRGVAQWRDNDVASDAACAWRIYLATHDKRLYALDARTGKSCVGFGDLGLVRLLPYIKEATPSVDRKSVRTYMPPAVVGNTVVVGSAIESKYRRANSPSGAVRAFDAATGEFRWAFDPVPRNSNSRKAKDWDQASLASTGGANVWSLMSVDEARDLVFLPTSSASPDFFGGTRPGSNAYANSTVALRGSTGEIAWFFQTVHHDVWGYDAASQPVLADIRQRDETIPAVVQLTTHGFAFVIQREVGVPVFPVEERKVPTTGVDGEVLSQRQPFPTAPLPLAQTQLAPEDAWGFTFYDKGMCRKKLQRFSGGEVFSPPTTQGTVIVPGAASGWGSGAFDSGRSFFITKVRNVPAFIRLVPLEQVDQELAESPNAGRPGGPPGVIDGTPYAVERDGERLLSPLGLPCTTPPWQSLVAIDLTDGSTAWSVPLGSLDKIAGLPLDLGAPGAGGPIVTAGGLVFVAGSADERFRAFDADSGDELWEHELPTSGMATPMTYQVGERQYVVIAAGGHHEYYPDGIGDYLVAFALPKSALAQ
ncbi:MAG: pyrroloquinoline quinone-dependent dehydrogenase [Gammaproteobacteria bacterium]